MPPPSSRNNGKPAWLNKAQQQAPQRNSGKKQPAASNKQALVQRKARRRHISFTNTSAKPVPVTVPSPEEKGDFWFQPGEAYVVIPRHLLIGAGKHVNLNLSNKYRLVSVAVVSDREQQRAAASEGEVVRSTVEIGTEGPSSTEHSAALMAMYGTEGSKNSAAARQLATACEHTAKRPDWMAIGTVMAGRPFVKLNFTLLPGVHSIRNNGSADVFLTLFSSGITEKLV